MDDGNLTLEIGKLIGQVQALHSRFNGVDVSLATMRSEVTQQVAEHERREDVRLGIIESQLETLKRLVWIGFGGTLVMGGAVSIVLAFFK